ncbi:hypothetical protein QOT17_002584 [Balamuthia mandrillaris]
MYRGGVCSAALLLLFAVFPALLCPAQGQTPGELEAAKDFPGSFHTLLDAEHKEQALAAIAAESANIDWRHYLPELLTIDFADSGLSLTNASLQGGAITATLVVSGMLVIFQDVEVDPEPVEIPHDQDFTVVIGVEYAASQLPSFNLTDLSGPLTFPISKSVRVPLPKGELVVKNMLPDLFVFLDKFMSKLHVVELELEGEVTPNVLVMLLENYTLVSESRVVLGSHANLTGGSTLFTFWILDGIASGSGSGNAKMVELYQQFNEDEEPHLGEYPVKHFDVQCCATCGDCKAGLEPVDDGESGSDGSMDGDGGAASTLAMLFF